MNVGRVDCDAERSGGGSGVELPRTRTCTHRYRHCGSNGRRLCLLALTIVALASATTSAAAGANTPVKARSSGACSNGRAGDATTGEAFYVFVLRGRLSCRKAHSLIASYFHVAKAKGCAGRGTMCGYNMPGGWWCSLAGYAGAHFDAGCCYSGTAHLASCRRGSASVGVYETSPPAGWHSPLHIRLFESPDGSIACEIDAFGASFARCSLSTRSQHALPAAFIERGRVTVCNGAPESLTETETPEGSACPGLSLNHKVVLDYGRETELAGLRCASAPNGMTCTVVSGAKAGKGFRINNHEAVAVG
jgi:hypothetical protein